MKEAHGKSCLLHAIAYLAVAALLSSILLWMGTGNLYLTVSFAAVVVGVALGVFLFFWLPGFLYAAGRYLGGKLAGMRFWHISVGPYRSMVDRDGVLRSAWSWRCSAETECVMLPVTLDRPVRQLKFYCRGGIYGIVGAVVLYALIGYGWMTIVESPLVFIIVGLVLLPVFSISRRLTQELDRAQSQANFASYYLAYMMVSFSEWMQLRPRDWDMDVVSVCDLPLDDATYRVWMLAHAFTYWNDRDDGGAKLKDVRDQLRSALEKSVIDTDSRDVFMSHLAFYSAVYERNAVEARWFLGDRLDLNESQVVGWRNAAVLAVHVLEGRMEEAGTLRDRMIGDSGDGPFQEYVEEQVGRVMGLRSDES